MRFKVQNLKKCRAAFQLFSQQNISKVFEKFSTRGAVHVKHLFISSTRTKGADFRTL